MFVYRDASAGDRLSAPTSTTTENKPPLPRHKAQVLPLVVHLSLTKLIHHVQNQSNATAINTKNSVLVCEMFPDSTSMTCILKLSKDVVT
jgi:hypothetical protein